MISFEWCTFWSHNYPHCSEEAKKDKYHLIGWETLKNTLILKHLCEYKIEELTQCSISEFVLSCPSKNNCTRGTWAVYTPMLSSYLCFFWMLRQQSNNPTATRSILLDPNLPNQPISPVYTNTRQTTNKWAQRHPNCSFPVVDLFQSAVTLISK